MAIKKDFQTLEVGQSVQVGGKTVTVERIHGDKVRLAIEHPDGSHETLDIDGADGVSVPFEGPPEPGDGERAAA